MDRKANGATVGTKANAACREKMVRTEKIHRCPAPQAHKAPVGTMDYRERRDVMAKTEKMARTVEMEKMGRTDVMEKMACPATFCILGPDELKAATETARQALLARRAAVRAAIHQARIDATRLDNGTRAVLFNALRDVENANNA